MAPALTAANAAAPAGGTPAREVRSIYTDEFGVSRPSGVTYDPDRKALLVTGAKKGADSALIAVTPDDTRLGSAVLRGLEDGGTAAYDPKQQELTAVEGGEQLAVPGKSLSAQPKTTDAPETGEARSSTYAPNGTWHVLDAAARSIVTTTPGGAVKTTPLHGVDGAWLRGLAFNPADGLLYLADIKADRLLAVNSSGRVVRTHDMSDAGINDLQAMTFGPSADTTDKASDQSLYVADAGDEQQLGRVAELTMEPAALAPTGAHTATLVATRDLSTLSPPSPDSSGIAYNPTTDRMIVSDGEVDEMPIYAGANLFTITRQGTGVSTATTVPWSNEPTGIGYHDGVTYISDDDKKSIFKMTGTGTPLSFKTSAFGNTDPEDVAYDTQRNTLLMVDGVGMEVFRLTRGANGVFDGVAPGGDDVASQFDMQRYLAEDPEGIAYDAVRDTIVVVDGSTDTIYELDQFGSLLNTIDISAANSLKAAGIAIAPASDGSGARHYYIVDRGLDNNSHPGENDGKMYEMSANLPAVGNRPPHVDAGLDQMIDLPDTANLVGSAVDAESPTLTYAWSKVSGPGTVTFGTPTSQNATATFNALGTYVLRLTAKDGQQATGFDDVQIAVHEPGGPRTIGIPILTGADDALQGGGSTGDFVDLASADVELGHDGPPTPETMITGLRFQRIPVPKGSQIISARIQFKVDEGGSEAANYTFKAEAHDDAPIYTAVKGSISARALGTKSSSWSPPAWPAPIPGEGGLAGPGQLTSELGPLVQEVVDRPGWVKGNAVNFIASGTGRRTAEAKDGLTPPVLVLTYKTPLSMMPSLTLSPKTVTYPGKTIVTGAVRFSDGSGVAGERVVVRSKTWPSTQFKWLRTVTTGADGRYSFGTRPTAHTTYQATHGTNVSTLPTVNVKPGLTAKFSSSRVTAGRTVKLTGSLTPSSWLARLRLQRYSGGKWVTVQWKSLRSGTIVPYTFYVKHSWPGSYRYRVLAPAYKGRAETKAPSGWYGLTLRVLRPPTR
ncbi:MAG: PKD domain-containing protein [Nocardioidaceae bacterium]